MTATTLVTGGCGYVGALAVEEMLRSGRRVRVLDALLHGQRDVVERQRALGVEVVEGDLREAEVRLRALGGVDEVVHLAAIVGDPACARDPETARSVNVEGTRALVADARAAGVRRLVFASTCSNYGRMTDPRVPIAEDGVLAPVSLYAEQKVAMEQMLLADGGGPLASTCLRFATVYGVAPRMRFDLTVNEFTRDLWADRDLEVFGEQFWRPYIHVRDAARGVRAALEAPPALVAGEVYNIGDSAENYRKLDLVELIRRETDCGEVVFVHRTEDPRDYKVAFGKVAERLGYAVTRTVPDGIREIIAALAEERFEDAFDGRYRNIA